MFLKMFFLQMFGGDLLKTIAVIGTGYVGLVSGTCFAEIGNDVICCDIEEEKVKKLQLAEVPFYEPGLGEMMKKNMMENRLRFTTNSSAAIQAADIVYIAVGTPMKEDGGADLKYVKAVAKDIGRNLNGYKIVVNKSTVPVGTGSLVYECIRDNQVDKSVNFDVVSNPEFLREGSAISDCMNMERAIIGSNSEAAAKVIQELHAPFNTQVMITDLESAEMIKYAANGFLATKISFINSIANICEKVGADVSEVAAGIGMDGRIGNRFLQAGIGYGGSCFPKDTHALLHIALEAGYSFDLMKSVISTNDKQRLTVIHKLHEIFGDLAGRQVGILGLTFKPNTDDMRYSPSIDIISKLHEEKAVIRAYDPVGLERAKEIIGNKASYFNDIYETIKGCDACVILTEWEEIVNLELDRLYSSLRHPVIVDGRNCMNRTDMIKHGFIYHSIGRKPIGQLKTILS